MYPTLINDSLELNVPYLHELLELLCFYSKEELEELLYQDNPESFNNLVQMQLVGWLIESWMIELSDSEDESINATIHLAHLTPVY